MRSMKLTFLFVALIGTITSGQQPLEEEEVVTESSERRKYAISLAESIRKSRMSYRDPDVQQMLQQYWRRTFDEIRNLTVGVTRNRDSVLLSQWKLKLEDTDLFPSLNASGSTRSFMNLGEGRFDGFPSWERLLQEWADDVQEYLEKIEQESGRGYAIGNFGLPPVTKNETKVQSEVTGAPSLVAPSPKSGATKQKSRVNLPIPAPAKPGEPVLPHTDLSDKSKNIWIVTTASLPWRTGTAVNPLLRAAYLSKGRKQAGGSVTLMLPWLERDEDQENVYGSKKFASQEEQEAFVRSWLRDSADMEEASVDLNIKWYTAWQNKAENSLYSMGDITALIPADEADICILEEPEHLNWYRAPGDSWTEKFKHVVGILHTNYFAYAMDAPAALVRAPAMRLLCSWMCRAHCHRIIKLSGTLDKVAPEKELVENVHGVRGTFLDVGEQLRSRLNSPTGLSDPVFGANADPKVYFIGKMMWTKGLGSLMELLKYAEESAGLRISVDMYGGGPDKDAANDRARKMALDMPFHGPLDHAELAFSHKIFINPSTSEVLCTTSAEALAMGKFVILPSHPSNDFFAQFPNCLSYTNKDEFVGNLYYALTHEPEPLVGEYAHALTWEAACERLEAASCIPVKEAELMAEALASEEAGLEIPLPPLVENEKTRIALATTLRFTRHRYRQFRSRLSTEIEQSIVLPKPLRDRLVSELDKRLDLDFDEMLESPKLRLKLSPGELDKNLLDLYKKVSESPGGDVLRLIGGGGFVGMQNLYMRRQAEKERRRNRQRGTIVDFLPSFSDDFDVEELDRTPAEWVRWALRRNLPSSKTASNLSNRRSQASSSGRKDPRMTATYSSSLRRDLPSWSGLRPTHSFFNSQKNSKIFSLLI